VRPCWCTHHWILAHPMVVNQNEKCHNRHLHILMPPLINTCSLWVYRHSPWRHWSFVHQILFWIEIGLKLVEKMVLNVRFYSIDHISPPSPKNYKIYTSWYLLLCSFSENQHSPWRNWSRVHQILCWIEIGLKLVEKDGLEVLLPQHWWSVHKHPKIYSSGYLLWSIYVRSRNIDIGHDDIDLVDIEFYAG